MNTTSKNSIFGNDAKSKYFCLNETKNSCCYKGKSSLKGKTSSPYFFLLSILTKTFLTDNHRFRIDRQKQSVMSAVGQ